ncbi:hypothetical protein EMCRGX_G006888 [Ephydatia muelleri]
METEEAAKVAKETVYGTKTSLVHKVDYMRRSRSPDSGENPTSYARDKKRDFPLGTCPRCGKSDHRSPDCPFRGHLSVLPEAWAFGSRRYEVANGLPLPTLGIFSTIVTLQGEDSSDVNKQSGTFTIRPIFSDLKPDLALQKACEQLCREFPDLFKPELGCFKDFQLEVKFKPDAKPIFCKPRVVPFAIQENLCQAYDAGIARGAHLPGQSAKLRICGDYSVTVNQQLEPHPHPMPLPEDLMRKLGGGHGFTKIDLADAYNQIMLAPESQSSAPGYFQEIMDQLTSDLQGVAVYMDDILVSGTTASEHIQNLRALLKCLEEKGLRCRLEKCLFAQPSVEYLSQQGIAKGPKVHAVKIGLVVTLASEVGFLKMPLRNQKKRSKQRAEYLQKREDILSQDNKAKARARYKADPEIKKASVRDTYKADPEKKKANVRDTYKADPEKKKALVRDTYNANAVSKRAAKRQRYQEGVEENRAAKRQRYQEGVEENRAAKRQRYQEGVEENRAAKRQRYQEGVEENRAANRRIYRGNSATIKAARRIRYWKGRRTTTTTQSYSLFEPNSRTLAEYGVRLEKQFLGISIEDLRAGLDALDSGCGHVHYDVTLKSHSGLIEQLGHPIYCELPECSSPLRIIRAAMPHFPALRTFTRLLYKARKCHMTILAIDSALASGNIEELIPFMGMKDNLSDLFSEDGVEHAVVSEDHSSSGLGCIERDLKVTHADLIAELHHPEKKKASVRNSYKADPEKKKASVRDSYNADIESKQSAKRQRYQEDVEENRAAKRQKYKDNSDAIKASERYRY